MGIVNPEVLQISHSLSVQGPEVKVSVLDGLVRQWLAFSQLVSLMFGPVTPAAYRDNMETPRYQGNSRVLLTRAV